MEYKLNFEQDSPKIIPSPWGLHCPLRVKYHKVSMISRRTLNSTKNFRKVDLGKGNRLSKKSTFCGPDQKLLPARPTSKNPLPLLS